MQMKFRCCKAQFGKKNVNVNRSQPHDKMNRWKNSEASLDKDFPVEIFG